MTKTLFFILCLIQFASSGWAGCLDERSSDFCGLEYRIETERSIFKPGEQIDFLIELVNTNAESVYIPNRVFQNGPLPCMKLPSGEMETFKAVYPAPECEKMSGEGDRVLEAGKSIEFTLTRPVYPVSGMQTWTFETVLYKCPDIANSMSCEIESNRVILFVHKISNVASYWLSTYSWEFAPWVRNFAHNLDEYWDAQYSKGLDQVSGETVLRITVDLNGAFRKIEIIEKSGHETFHITSLPTIEKIAGKLELPEDFPDQELVITISINYPALR